MTLSTTNSLFAVTPGSIMARRYICKLMKACGSACETTTQFNTVLEESKTLRHTMESSYSRLMPHRVLHPSIRDGVKLSNIGSLVPHSTIAGTTMLFPHSIESHKYLRPYSHEGVDRFAMIHSRLKSNRLANTPSEFTESGICEDSKTKIFVIVSDDDSSNSLPMWLVSIAVLLMRVSPLTLPSVKVAQSRFYTPF
jgi:hypothetical protein